MDLLMLSLGYECDYNKQSKECIESNFGIGTLGNYFRDIKLFMQIVYFVMVLILIPVILKILRMLK